jgi:hypothetical protein
VVVEDGRIVESTRCPHDVIRWAQLKVPLEGAETEADARDRLLSSLASLVADIAPLPVAVRIHFTGQTAAHAAINGDLEYWTQAVRSTAVAQFGERVWIEKVQVVTSPPPAQHTAVAEPGPLREMNRLMADLLASDDELLALGQALTPLWRKLPVDYRQGEGALDPEDPECWRAIVRQVQDLLVKGLKKERTAP